MRCKPRVLVCKVTQKRQRRYSSYVAASAPSQSWGHWRSVDNQRDSMDGLAEELNVKVLSEWYNVTKRDVRSCGRSGLLKRYGDSVSTCLKVMYPNFNWHPWKFSSAPQRYWGDIKNQYTTINEFAEGLNIKTLEGWYNIEKSDILNYGGNVMQSFGTSLCQWLISEFPNYDWKPWQFKVAPKRYWDTTENQRLAMEHVGEILDIKHLDEWYEVTGDICYKYGLGGMLTKMYNMSISLCLSTLYPNHDWILWRFNKPPVRYWQGQAIKDNVESVETGKKKTRLEYTRDRFSSLREQLKITSPEMWYRVSVKQFQQYNCTPLLRYWPQVLRLLEPNFSWDWRNFNLRNKQTTQKLLLDSVRRIFPQYQVEEETFIEMASIEGGLINVDVYVPEINLAIEYQGEQHYGDVLKWHPSNMQQARDAEKKQVCKVAGICVVPIPFTWTGDIASIVATIQYYKPSLALSVPIGARPLIENTNNLTGEQVELMAPNTMPVM